MKQRGGGVLTQHVGICRAEKDLAAEQLAEIVCRAEMIVMAVGMDDIANIVGIKARLPNRLDQHMHGMREAAVKEDQAVMGVEQVDAHAAIPHVP